MKILFIFVFIFQIFYFQDSSLFYDTSAKKNLKFESRAFDFVLKKEPAEDDSNKIIRVVSFNEQQEQVYFSQDDPKIPLQEFLWESKLSNLFIFPIQDKTGQHYKIKLESESEYESLIQAVGEEKNIQDLQGEVELEKAQDLDIMFDQVFFPQKTLQDDLSLEIQMMKGVIMQKIMNVTLFLSGNFESVVQFQYSNDKFVALYDEIQQLGLCFANNNGDGFDLNPIYYFDYLYQQKKNSNTDFDEYKIKNQFSGFQNFKADPWIFLNLNTSQLTLGNTDLIKLSDLYHITNEKKEVLKEFTIDFDIDFGNGFKFFASPLDFMSSYLDKVESKYQDEIVSLKEEDQEEGTLNPEQEKVQESLKDIFIDNNKIEFYFEVYCHYFAEFLKKFYEHTLLKYTAQAVPFQSYKDQYYQKFKENEQSFDQKSHPINQSSFKFNVLSQIFEFFVELQGLTTSEYFSCLNQNLDEKNAAHSKCLFFLKEQIQFFGQNPKNVINITDLKNLAFGNYDKDFDHYLRILRQFVKGHFHLTFKKYITKTYQELEQNIQQLVIQKLSFAKGRILI